MYLRWKRNFSRKTGHTTLRIVLVRSVWKNGKPQQVTVGDLGRIVETNWGDPEAQQVFLADVYTALLFLDDITDAERMKLMVAFRKLREKIGH